MRTPEIFSIPSISSTETVISWETMNSESYMMPYPVVGRLPKRARLLLRFGCGLGHRVSVIFRVKFGEKRGVEIVVLSAWRLTRDRQQCLRVCASTRQVVVDY